MGLDMYLKAKKYLGANYPTIHPESVPISDTIQKLLGVTYPVQYIDFHVGDWRKANQIHRWFVDNVQGGTDDCEEYEVTLEQLKTLMELCEKVRDNPERAQELLPTAQGFFFGGTEYDEWYFNDIDTTIDMISKILVEQEMTKPDLSFYYQSSW